MNRQPKMRRPRSIYHLAWCLRFTEGTKYARHATNSKHLVRSGSTLGLQMRLPLDSAFLAEFEGHPSANNLSEVDNNC
jgi:hypothetical protein